MQIYEELQARGLIAQVTDEDEIKELEAKPKTVEASEPAWGSSSWGQQTGWRTQSGWGTTKEKTVEVDV